MSSKLSDTFKLNFLIWNFFGIWPGDKWNKRYKYYSYGFLLVMFINYNILLTINLFYTPGKIQFIIREVIFYFTEVAIAFKVLMILFMRNKIIAVFEILNSNSFEPKDDVSCEIINKSVNNYKSYWKINVFLSNFSYTAQVILPIIRYLIFGTKLRLPLCKYYFLSDELRESIFTHLFIYQAFGLFVHMMYNITVDTFNAGLILMPIAQLKILNHKLRYLKVTNEDLTKTNKEQDKIQTSKLKELILHYNLILDYCSGIQTIMNITMFVQLSMVSATICVVLCGLLLPSTTEVLIFLSTYLFTISLKIFVQCWLGTQLSYESGQIRFAVYSSEWLQRSESYKKSMRIFIERTNRTVVLTGLKFFPVSIQMFNSILKLAYSFFTLVRNVQMRQENRA